MPVELIDLVESQARAWEEFKAANDARLIEIEKRGAADVLTNEKVDRLNAELSAIQRAFKERVDGLEKRLNRPGRSGGDECAEVALKIFNVSLKSHNQRLNRERAAELTLDEFDAYKGAFGAYLRKDSRSLSAEEFKSLSAGSDPDGGYLCPVEMDAAIDRVVSSQGAMRSLATVRAIGAASYKKLVTTSGASAGGWGGEATAPSETGTPGLKELEIVPGLLWAEPRATTQLLEDSGMDAEAWLADEVGLTFAEQEGDAFIYGTGVNKPRGILSYTTIANASYSWGNVGFVVTGGASGFASSNPSDALMDLIHALKRQYRNNATFVMNDAVLGTIRKFKDGQGIYLWVPGLQQGQVGALLGYPVATDDFMPDLGSNAFPVAFGDFRRGYVIADRRGTVVIRDNLTAKPYVKFFTTRRVGGGIQNFEAIKLLKCST